MPGHKLPRASSECARKDTDHHFLSGRFLHVLMVFKPLPLTCFWPGRGCPGSPSAWIAICSEVEDYRGISGAGRHWETAKEGAGIATKESLGGGAEVNVAETAL